MNETEKELLRSVVDEGRFRRMYERSPEEYWEEYGQGFELERVLDEVQTDFKTLTEDGDKTALEMAGGDVVIYRVGGKNYEMCAGSQQVLSDAQVRGSMFGEFLDYGYGLIPMEEALDLSGGPPDTAPK